MIPQKHYLKAAEDAKEDYFLFQVNRTEEQVLAEAKRYWVEELAEQIHQVYCRYKKEVHGEDYWTGGDYSKLEDQWKEADRYMARFVIEQVESQVAALLNTVEGEK